MTLVSSRRGEWEDGKMSAQSTKLEAAENDLKELLADVTRAMEKAQEAVARVASKAEVAAATTESTSR